MYDSNWLRQTALFQGHKPFTLRKIIVFAGIVAGLISYSLLNNPYLALCIYLVAITLADQVMHYLVPIKASLLVNPKELLSSEKISPENLDRHYAAKTHVRLISLGVALVSQIFLLSSLLFLGTFAVATLAGRLYARYRLEIVGPKIFHMRELTPEEQSSLHERGRQNSREMDLGTTTGVGLYGTLKDLRETSH